MPYSSHSITVTTVSNEYQFSSTTEWTGVAYLNMGYTVPTAPNSEGRYEIILEVEEDSQGTPAPVVHEFSLEDMGVTPPDDAQITVIVKEGQDEHGRVDTSLIHASEPKRPIPDLSSSTRSTGTTDTKRPKIELPNSNEKPIGASEPKRPIILPNDPPEEEIKR